MTNATLPDRYLARNHKMEIKNSNFNPWEEAKFIAMMMIYSQKFSVKKYESAFHSDALTLTPLAANVYQSSEVSIIGTTKKKT